MVQIKLSGGLDLAGLEFDTCDIKDKIRDGERRSSDGADRQTEAKII